MLIQLKVHAMDTMGESPKWFCTGKKSRQSPFEALVCSPLNSNIKERLFLVPT